MNPKYIITPILIPIVFFVSTAIHEYSHIAVAHMLNIECELDYISMMCGRMTLYGHIASTDMAMIAAAGSIGIIIFASALMVLPDIFYSKVSAIIIFGRAWLDMRPIAGLDGGVLVESIGYNITIYILVVEIIVCAIGVGVCITRMHVMSWSALNSTYGRCVDTVSTIRT